MDRITTLLNILSAHTLAAIAADLEDAVEDWGCYYPEEAPSPDTQRQISQTLEMVLERGAALTNNFGDLLNKAHDARDKEDWISDRNRQVQQNWYSDLE